MIAGEELPSILINSTFNKKLLKKIKKKLAKSGHSNSLSGLNGATPPGFIGV